MRLNIKYLLCALACLSIFNISAQTTSWIGGTSTNWSTSSNWTNGVPNSSRDAIIGNASFTGSNQPILTNTSTCRNLTIGNGSSTVSLSIARNLNITGDLLIGSNGTINASTANRIITIDGDWTNNGTYNASSNSARVTFSGTSTQILTGATTFQRVTIDNNGILQLASSIVVNDDLTVTGTINPSTYTISGTSDLDVQSTGIIYVYTSTFVGNYNLSGGVTLNRTSTVNYASSSIAQTVSNAFTYGILRISGSTTKSLTGNLPGLSSSNSSSGRIFIDAGVFDLGIYTANRSTTGGGSVTISSGAKLMIGGTNTFPSNYTTITLAANSTVEYYGNNQTIMSLSYGNLSLKSTSGSVVKTMPSSSMVIAGLFYMSPGTGTAVSATAAQNITFNGGFLLESGTTFSAASYTMTFQSDFENNGVFTGATSSLVINNTTVVLDGLGNSDFNHVTINSSGQLVLNTTININRNFTVNGSFNGYNGKVVFSGSTASVIGGSISNVQFGDLEVNKSGVNTTLSRPVTINGELILTLGNIVTSATNYLNIADNATASSGSSISFVNGPMRKTGNDAFVFPIGKGTTWARIGISAPSNVNDAFTAEYFDATYSNVTSIDTSSAPLNNVSIMEYWNLNRTVGSSSANVTLYWENSLSGINNYSSDLVVAHWNGSAWENVGQTAITASTPGNITSGSISSFSPFTFGSTSTPFNPLPISLLNFDGFLNSDNSVDLQWRTASETNNHYFTIEKSRDGIHFTDLIQVQAAGNSQTVQSYSANDFSPYNGKTFYRLRQTDVNGESTVSKIIVISVNIENSNRVSIYPNPSNGIVNISINSIENSRIIISNSIGLVVQIINPETDNFTIDLTEYPSGIYFIQLETSSIQESVKIIKY